MVSAGLFDRRQTSWPGRWTKAWPEVRAGFFLVFSEGWVPGAGSVYWSIWKTEPTPPWALAPAGPRSSRLCEKIWQPYAEPPVVVSSVEETIGEYITCECAAYICDYVCMIDYVSKNLETMTPYIICEVKQQFCIPSCEI